MMLGTSYFVLLTLLPCNLVFFPDRRMTVAMSLRRKAAPLAVLAAQFRLGSGAAASGIYGGTIPESPMHFFRFTGPCERLPGGC